MSNERALDAHQRVGDGQRLDVVGARLIIPVGIVLALAGTAAYTQIGAETSYVFLAGALFVIGLGLGATIVPSMAVAYQAVPGEAVAQATSTINVIQRIAASVGTALLAVVLQRSIATNLPGFHDGIGALAGLPNHGRARAAPALADAFGTTFWFAFGLVGAALLPAVLLPRIRPQARGPQAPPGAGARRPDRAAPLSPASPVTATGAPLKDAAEWLETYRRFWGGSFDQLDRKLRANENRADDGSATIRNRLT